MTFYLFGLTKQSFSFFNSPNIYIQAHCSSVLNHNVKPMHGFLSSFPLAVPNRAYTGLYVMLVDLLYWHFPDLWQNMQF